MKGRTTAERASEREMVVTRTFDALPHLVFEAWTNPALLKQWWAPKSTGMTLIACDADVRAGGKYRFEFGHGTSTSMVFFGSYLEVVPRSRLVWTNEESNEGAVTTVTFEEKDGKTRVVMRERYPSKEALDAALGGMEAGMTETFAQLDELLLGQGTQA
jgi:uncharacterized protein YndB with AHSA1/START domain